VISTHVLDTGRGKPAAGVTVELYRGESLLAAAQTDADGRIAELAPSSLESGTYRLVFHPPSEFFRRVELEIAVDDPQGHYHVPLLVSPYSCASYRGS
jgi:5-hydroxyisourate hydrolase